MANKTPLYINAGGGLNEYGATDTIPQANITWKTPSFTSSIVDLSGANAIVDNSFSAVSIPDTTKPGSPQYTQTVPTLPVNSGVLDYCILFAVGGAVTGITGTMNYAITRNGTEMLSQTAIAITATRFWHVLGRIASVQIAAGDTIGIKLWVSIAGEIDYQYSSLYVIPRLCLPGNSDVFCTTFGAASGNTLNISGANAGVTYTASPLNSTFYNPTLAATFGSAASVGSIGKGDNILITGSIADGALGSSGVATVKTLFAPSIQRYFRKLIPTLV